MPSADVPHAIEHGFIRQDVVAGDEIVDQRLERYWRLSGTQIDALQRDRRE